MVNTFITSTPDDIDKNTGKKGFRLSASNLDKQRLWKQVIEARQILDLVENYHFLGNYFQIPCPSNPYLIKDWTKKIMNKYKNLDNWLFRHQDKWIWYPKNKSKPIKVKYDETYHIQENGTILYKNKVYPKYSLILPKDKLITMGFGYHPIVIMWMLNIESLKYYINCHIEEFLERGGKTETRKLLYNINISEIIHPIWAFDSNFIQNHRAALATKEIVRNEHPWYIYKADFKNAYLHYLNSPHKNKTKTTSSFEYYIWVFTQDIDNQRYIVKECLDNRCVISFK